MASSQNSEDNVGIGVYTLMEVSGRDNTAIGDSAQTIVTSGSYNVGIGNYTHSTLLTGSSNIALGYEAGYNILQSNNIDIGNQGTKTDTGIIRIGSSGIHKNTFIQGIYKVPVTDGAAVFINSAGQLGTVVSSERFKTGIQSISDATPLQELRPVTYRLKGDPKRRVQYGLIAEEVAKVYPDLVVRDEHGRIDSLRYDELTPLLLYQLQQDRKEMQENREENRRNRQEIANLRSELGDVQGALAMLTPSPNKRVATR
jgi:hypothetical protein